MTPTPTQRWILPKLTELLAQAKSLGIPQQLAVAVLSDLPEGPEFNLSPPGQDSAS